MKRLLLVLALLAVIVAVGLSHDAQAVDYDELAYLPMVANPEMTTLYVNNQTGAQLCYEVFDTGIGRKCVSEGVHQYGVFPSGDYEWHVSTRCGEKRDVSTYPPGEIVHEFACVPAMNTSLTPMQ